ncbi:hypothetical protein N301_14380, partial [Charadrius vociferus]
MRRRKQQEKKKTSAGHVSRQHRLAPCSTLLETLASSSVLNPAPGCGLPGRCAHWTSSTALAGQAPSAVVAATKATKATKAKAPGVDGHSFLTQDAANGRGGGGSHS